MLKIGHRGACGYEPENTLASFQKALELKVDMIELDVYVCKSGELVVIHDDKVDRTTNGHGYVIEKTLTELQVLNAGKGQKVPQLIEVLDLNRNHVPVNIELKGEHTSQPVADMINEYIKKHGWKFENFLVSSFNHRELSKFQKICPGVHVGVLFVGIPLTLNQSLTGLDTYSINLSQEFINQEIVDEAHSSNLKVLVYTVNDLDDILRIKKLGVNGIFSNFPDRL